MARKKSKKIKVKPAKKSVKKSSNVKVILNPKKKQLRRDFEVFAKGVERLEELRTELNNLNTCGYEVEVAAIRSKLKNVSYIPEIEKEIEDLKLKINGVHKEKKEKPARNIEFHRKINELKKQIPKENAKLHRKIEELKEHAADKAKVNSKLRELEDEIKNKRIRKQLSKEQVEDIEEIPRLEHQVSDLKKFVEEQEREERRKREILKTIDPGINFLINNKFNMSLNEIKAELSNKLRNRESEIKKQLQEDLEARKKSFEQQYQAIEDDFSRRYQDKVASSLQKEVNSRFNDALKKRLEILRKKLENDSAQKLAEKKSELDAKE